MMWKESYRLGVDSIDRQHKELFVITARLIQAVEQQEEREIFEEIVAFLKQYVILHFKEEEEYQKQIGYGAFEEHRQEHIKFTKLILGYERELTRDGYSLHTLKELAGTLTTWLVYHVSDMDQRMVEPNPIQGDHAQKVKPYLEIFADCVVHVLHTMVEQSPEDVHISYVQGAKPKSEFFVEIRFIKDMSKRVVFGYTQQIAKGLFERMTMMEVESIDEMVLSALCEVTNISCGNMTMRLKEQGITSDITTPSLIHPVEEPELFVVELKTDLGDMEILVEVPQVHP